MTEQPSSESSRLMHGPTSGVDLPAPQPVSRPRVWTVFAAIAVALVASFVSQIVVVAVLAAIEIAAHGSPQELATTLPKKLMNPPTFIGMLILSQTLIGLAALIPAWMSAVPLRERLGLQPTRLGLGFYPIVMIGTLLPLALGIGAAHLVAQFIQPDETALMLYEQMTSTWAIPFIIVIGVAPGVMEELFFRGYVQRRLIQRWSPGTGIVVTSIVFGLFHVTPHAIAMATLLGLWLGLLAWRTDSVWPGVCCHAFVNSSWNIWQVGQRLWGFPEIPPMALSVVAGVLVGACFLATLRLLSRAPSTSTQKPAVSN